MPDLKTNIKGIQERMFIASSNAVRGEAPLQLVAASKTQQVATIREAYDMGLRDFGENYVSEAVEKMPALPDDITWHFLGPIQSNKTRLIASSFHVVHTVDREKIVQRLSAQRPEDLPPLQCLVQVNISAEPQKAGVAPEDVFALADLIAHSDRLALFGLMAIPKANQPQAALEKDFAAMQALSKRLQGTWPSACHLSMGMTQDFELAIRYGATFVRIGTALFGARDT